MPVDVADCVAAMETMKLRMHIATLKGTSTSARFVQSRTMALAPVLTGNLRRSIDVQGPIMLSEGTYLARIGPTTVYGRQRELGGDIYPRTAPALHFFWLRMGGIEVYAHHVYQHPEPYLKPAVMQSTDSIRAIFTNSWAAAILA